VLLPISTLTRCAGTKGDFSSGFLDGVCLRFKAREVRESSRPHRSFTIMIPSLRGRSVPSARTAAVLLDVYRPEPGMEFTLPMSAWPPSLTWT
jgi:hypothetical protein